MHPVSELMFGKHSASYFCALISLKTLIENVGLFSLMKFLYQLYNL